MAILNTIQFPGSTEVFEIADAQARAALENKVDSVNGKTGAVTLTAENVGALPASGGSVTGNLTVGSTASTERAAATVGRLGSDGAERELTAFISSGNSGRIELRTGGVWDAEWIELPGCGFVWLGRSLAEGKEEAHAQ